MNTEQIEAQTVQRHIVRCLSGGSNMGWISAKERANIESWLASATASEGRIAEARNAALEEAKNIVLKQCSGLAARDIRLSRILDEIDAALAGSATPSAPPAVAGWVHGPDLEWSRDSRQAAIRQERSEWYDTPVYFSEAVRTYDQFIIFGGKRMGKTYLANLEQDAARYRWLKECNGGSIGIVAWHRDEDKEMILTESYADQAIDAARTAAIESDRATLKEGK